MTALLILLIASQASLSGYDVERPSWTKDGTTFFAAGMEEVAVDGRTNQERQLKEGEPLTEVKASRTSPDGKAKAVVQIKKGAGGAWKDGVWSPSVPALVQLGVERDGQVFPSATWNGGLSSLQTFWSPDGKRIAWVMRTSDWQGMDGSKSWEILLGTAGLPRVQLLANKALVATALPKVQAALEKAGYLVTGAGKAQKERPKTVIYAAAGQETLAKKVADAIPGGATVEALTWKANADVVVACGASVTGGAK